MSFKLRLVAYFLLVSLLPLGAAGLALHSVTKRSETRRVDAHLETGLRAVLGSYRDKATTAARAADALARSPRFQQALQRGDQTELRRMLEARQGVRLTTKTFTTKTETSWTIGPRTCRSCPTATTRRSTAAPGMLVGTGR